MALKQYKNKFSCLDCALCSIGLAFVVAIGAVLGGLMYEYKDLLEEAARPVETTPEPAPLDRPEANLTRRYQDCSNKMNLPRSAIYANEPFFRCPDEKCILSRLRCDQRDDCADGADEEDCQNLCPKWIGDGLSFKCANTTDSAKCLPVGLRCNGMMDCADGSDERNCQDTVNIHPGNGEPTIVCTAGWPYCSGKCFPKSYECDGKADCPTGSDGMAADERNCTGKFWS